MPLARVKKIMRMDEDIKVTTCTKRCICLYLLLSMWILPPLNFVLFDPICYGQC